MNDIVLFKCQSVKINSAWVFKRGEKTFLLYPTKQMAEGQLEAECWLS